MKSDAFIRLHHLLGMARAAEESRLARATAEIAVCRARAARLRRQIGEPCVDAATRGDTVVAADMIAASRWMGRLAERAGTDEARAAALETEAEEIRKCLASAFGRESVAAGMLEKARAEERGIAARRAEAAIITPRMTPAKTPDQWASSDSASFETSAGSPGIA